MSARTSARRRSPRCSTGRFSAAVCFEPEPKNIVDLRLNLLINGLDERATALGVAISDSIGTAQFVANTHYSGQGWIATDESHLSRLTADDETISVPTTTLDELVASGVIASDRVGLLWIDAQSHEGHILAGATRLLEQGVPIVLEWHPRALARLGDREVIEQRVAEHYTHFIDLRPATVPGQPNYHLHESAALADYVQPFTDGSSPRSYTDILIMRLPAGVAEGLDAAGAIARADAASKGPTTLRTRIARAKTALSPNEKPRASKPRKPKADAKSKADAKPKAPASAKPRKSKSRRASDRDELREAARALLAEIDADPERTTANDPALRDLKRSPEARAMREAKRAVAARRNARPPQDDAKSDRG